MKLWPASLSIVWLVYYHQPRGKEEGKKNSGTGLGRAGVWGWRNGLTRFVKNENLKEMSSIRPNQASSDITTNLNSEIKQTSLPNIHQPYFFNTVITSNTRPKWLSSIESRLYLNTGKPSSEVLTQNSFIRLKISRSSCKSLIGWPNLQFLLCHSNFLH